MTAGVIGAYKGVPIEIYTPPKGAVLTLRFDTEKDDLDFARRMMEYISEAYPDNPVVCLPTSFSARTMTADELEECREQIRKALNEPDYFGVVRWCDGDIEEALSNHGYKVTDDAIAIIRKQCEHHFFKDNMIASGWHCIDCYIEECAEQLEEEE